MRKVLMILFVLTCSVMLIIIGYHKLTHSKTPKSIKTNSEPDENDGKQEAQDLEFKKTRDIQLGYVPLNKLLSSYQSLIDSRKALLSKKTPYSFPGLS